jgi:hypothetical protein
MNRRNPSRKASLVWKGIFQTVKDRDIKTAAPLTIALDKFF